ncbi:hypothetical protein BDC45DRAFT_36090 [Circinella umbellata]|nr:hypothetical protein BDC45DRAFT_36090 [Circinella umbellata]
MVSYEEACCIALEIVPSPSRFKHAVELMEATPFSVVYEKGKDPKKSTVLAKTIIEKNPFIWQKYQIETSDSQSSTTSSSNVDPRVNYSETYSSIGIFKSKIYYDKNVRITRKTHYHVESKSFLFSTTDWSFARL